ncbi:ER lumen protein-retaining receptor-like [Colletes gigas]|uniref:ER lumen protein-retaining receptor-like n=1 Tax=Colletes gigas TaxID=935657 RepID=UPI001C9B66CE|nr:ER lumen protein-retaining receptor-like [Colletes gigas]
MDVIRLSGDLLHLLAIFILLFKIWEAQSCAGISGKSEILLAIVFTTRYLDLATTYISAYNTFMKALFIITTYFTVYLMYVKCKATYDHKYDTFRSEILIMTALILALFINHEFTIMEVAWTFSIYLESVAILPQLFLMSKTGKAESITSHYLLALGSYRALYLIHWVYRYYTEGWYDLIVVVAGSVQTVLFCGFFCLPVYSKSIYAPNDKKYVYTLQVYNI